jgi:hypothetical protein
MVAFWTQTKAGTLKVGQKEPKDEETTHDNRA